jgi:hypothetical protein
VQWLACSYGVDGAEFEDVVAAGAQGEIVDGRAFEMARDNVGSASGAASSLDWAYASRERRTRSRRSPPGSRRSSSPAISSAEIGLNAAL